MTNSLPCRYRQLDQVLKGGMGEVIVCQDLNLDRKVAIKFIQDDNDTSRLTDEIQAMCKLHQDIRSKHIVQIFDVILDEENRRPGIVQEYIEGEDLVSRVLTQELSKNEYIKILYQIISGISDIHEKDLIHRDIKPNNIKFDAANLIKIFDFGLTRTENQNNSTMGFKGTTLFAAPELYSSGFVHFTKAIDIYAFGVTARYIAGLELDESFSKIPPSTSPKPSFKEVTFELSNDITNILDQTLAFNPQDRPSAQTIKDVLKKHLLFGKHRALLTSNGRTEVISKDKSSVNLNIDNVGSLTIQYNGLDFVVAHYAGNITVNRNSIRVNQLLPNNCVITFEGDHSRTFITFDISNPEVVL
ncbi:hypothetical protein AWQ21_04240 [Picosynechococcus sp. PCC 7003]|uniref:serine/threonine-protein kinase n=1 Tax=Picosynechococcus sp. PCC 7003 TaxID=374981 RepID=UPI0008106793|nr:serine/threonine-protein kinase [Picosynechococcus sp. PCC 7003]ANV83659.1 hypothetical protein AWQ21_04240 [Picosynechococcus sp. PCC 7003]